MTGPRIFGLLTAFLAIGALAAAPLQEPEEEEQYTIKDVMKQAHGKDGLLKKVATGDATDEEKQQLLVFYQSMAKNSPPQGEQDSWDERTKLLIEAAQAAVDGDEDAADKLLTATDCKSCHDAHK
ncbi:MAG: hypothetical protein ACR2NP_17305 [Pirellulaceae bacterium]